MTTNNASLAREIAKTAIMDWEPESFGIPISDEALKDFQKLGEHLTEMITAALDAKDRATAKLISDVEIERAFWDECPEWLRNNKLGRFIVTRGDSLAFYKAGYRAALAKLRGSGFKFKATDEWYRKAAEAEEGHDISAALAKLRGET